MTSTEFVAVGAVAEPLLGATPRFAAIAARRPPALFRADLRHPREGMPELARVYNPNVDELGAFVVAPEGTNRHSGGL